MCIHVGKYSRMLDATDDEIEIAREELQQQGDEEALEDFEDEDNIYARVSCVHYLFLSLCFLSFFIL